MARRAFDELKERWQKSLHLRRSHPQSSLLSSLQERFAPFPGAPEAWSALLWEATPPKVSLWSAPNGRQHLEVLISAQHRLRWRVGLEFGGPLVMHLTLLSQGSLLAEVALRVQGVTSREQSKDLAFRCAHLVGLSVYRTLQEDPEHLILEFSNEQQPATQQNAYREELAAPTPVPPPRQPAAYHSAPRVIQHATPTRAPDDSYLVASWSPTLLHFYASQDIDWERPLRTWNKQHLRECIFDLTYHRLTIHNGTRRTEAQIAMLEGLYLHRQSMRGSHAAKLGCLGASYTLAESLQKASPREPYELLAPLATSLAEALAVTCLTDITPQHAPLKLIAVSAAPELIFAGSDGERAIVWAPDGQQEHAAFTTKKGAFVGVSSRDSTWMIKDTGDLYRRVGGAEAWRELRPVGRRALNAVCQNQAGVAIAVGDRGCIMRNTGGDEWSGVLVSTLPAALQREDLISACSVNDAFFIASKRGNLYRSADGGETWRSHSAFPEELNALGASEDGRLWVACNDGTIYYAKFGRSFEKLAPPFVTRIHAVCAGPRHAAYAVGEAGAIWLSKHGAQFTQLPHSTKIERAFAKLSRDTPPPEHSGALSRFALTWHPTPSAAIFAPRHDWYGAHWHDGFLYVVGEAGLLLRIEAGSGRSGA